MSLAIDPGTSWQSHRVLTFNGQFDTKINTGEEYNTLALADIIGAVPTSRPKAKAPAFIPSTYAWHNGREHATQRENGRFVALTGDIDKGDVPLADLLCLTREFVDADAAVFIYSTGSATHTDKRWRIIIPLDDAVPFQRWNDAQEGFFDCMQASGVLMDRALARAAQPVFLPNVPIERRDVDGIPFFYQHYAYGEKGVQL